MAVVTAAAALVRSSCTKLDRQATAPRLAARVDLIERAKGVEVEVEGSDDDDDDMLSMVAVGFPAAAAVAAAPADSSVDLTGGADL